MNREDTSLKYLLRHEDDNTYIVFLLDYQGMAEYPKEMFRTLEELRFACESADRKHWMPHYQRFLQREYKKIAVNKQASQQNAAPRRVPRG